MVGQSADVDAVLTDQQLELWKSVFEHLTGLQLAAGRESQVRALLLSRVTATEAPSCGDYLHGLLHAPATRRSEWQLLIDRIAIGETRFFRHQPTFDLVGREAGARLRASRGGAPVTAWSLGCSSGEETWSLAMTLYRARAGMAGGGSFSVLGTDIGNAVETASAGVYANVLARGLDQKTARAFFDDLGDGTHRVRDFLRQAVTFRRHNILEALPAVVASGLDIICCQNVLIYFQQWRRRAVVRRLVTALKPGGLLILGPGDLGGWKPDGLERIREPDVQAYRRVG